METKQIGKEYLVYIRPICKNAEGEYEYDFYFSNTPDIVYGPEWDDPNPSAAIGGDLAPDPTTYNLIKKVKTTLPIKTIQETSCYSMEYAMNGIIALGWINIEGLDEYPENGRMVLMFGYTLEETQEMLKEQGFSFVN